jgi:hypothetical protein
MKSRSPYKAAIIIIAHRATITTYERISLLQCLKVFASRPIFLVCPKNMDIAQYRDISTKINFDFIAPHWQKDYRSFNRLKVLPFLYKKYIDYDYLLFYELDAFVFRDELDHWMAMDYDYIGAPWKRGWDCTDEDSPFIGVGNGGFSLRKVKSHIKVLNSFSYLEKPKLLAARRCNRKFLGKVLAFRSAILDLTIRNNTYFLFNSYQGNEDVFWGLIASRNFNWFNVAPIDEAIKFSFETHPRSLYLMNQKNLPFGCHGWWKYGFEFWKPFIIKEGYFV